MLAACAEFSLQGLTSSREFLGVDDLGSILLA